MVAGAKKLKMLTTPKVGYRRFGRVLEYRDTGSRVNILLYVEGFIKQFSAYYFASKLGGMTYTK